MQKLAQVQKQVLCHTEADDYVATVDVFVHHQLQITSEILHSNAIAPGTGFMEGAFFLPVIITHDDIRHSICLFS